MVDHQVHQSFRPPVLETTGQGFEDELPVPDLDLWFTMPTVHRPVHREVSGVLFDDLKRLHHPKLIDGIVLQEVHRGILRVPFCAEKPEPSGKISQTNVLNGSLTSSLHVVHSESVRM